MSDDVLQLVGTTEVRWRTLTVRPSVARDFTQICSPVSHTDLDVGERLQRVAVAAASPLGRRQRGCRHRNPVPRRFEAAMDDNMLMLMTLSTCTATALALRMWQWLDELARDDSQEDFP